jgi:hypothetical protein
MSWLGSIKHTQGETWGGTQVDLNIYKAISVLGGFFGLDHFFLRSPKSGVVKFLVNLCTFGFWYMYDLIQIFTDSEQIKKFGLTIPLAGPSGIGAGMFHGDGLSRAAKTTPNPYIFLAFAALAWVPFGLSHFIAGDFYGGAAKFFITFSPLFIMGFLWSFYTMFNVISNTPGILTKGTDRFFPATLFMNSNGEAPNIMIPVKEEEQSSGFAEMLTGLTGLLGPFEKPILQAVVGAGEVGINAAENVKSVTDLVTETVPLQTGGALSNSSTLIFLGLSSMILFGSLVLTAVRYSRTKKSTDSTNDVPPEISDEPPPGSAVF